MNWLRRRGVKEAPPAPPAPRPPTVVPDPAPERIERPTRGVATLFAEVGEDRRHSVLDLGTATNSSLQVYGSVARWIRFGDLLASAADSDEVEAALASIPQHPHQAYDILLAWNLLDRVAPDLRPHIIERLVEISAPTARMHLLVEMPGEGPRQPLRFGLEAADRLWYEPEGAAVAAWPPLLPAEVERLVEPFRVERAFTTRAGFREYVVVRRD